MPRGPRRPRIGSGISAVCRRCGQDILAGERLVKHHGEWIHRGCASGADDE